MMLNGFPSVICGLVLSSFSTAVVCARIYCRRYKVARLSGFDYVMVLALLGTWGITALNHYQVYVAPDLPRSTINTIPNREQEDGFNGVLLSWYLYRAAYPAALFLVKLSILLFYVRLAEGANTTFRNIIYATIILLCIYTITIVSVSVFICGKPSNGYSFQTFSAISNNEFRRPTCLDVNTIWFAQSGFNLLTDVVILILPMPILLRLNIPVHKKIALIAVFNIALIAVTASCIRVWIMSEWSKSITAQGRYGYIMIIGGQIELNAGIVSACIPFLKPLFRSFEDRNNAKV